MSSTRGSSSAAFDAVVDTEGVANGSRHAFLSSLATQVSRLAVSIVLARLLTPSDFGVVAAGLVVMVVVWQLADLGTAAVVIQLESIDQGLMSSLFYFNVVMGAVLTAITFLAAEPLALALGQPEATPAIQVLALVTLLGCLGNMHHALLRRTMRFGRLAVIHIAHAVVGGVVGVALALAGAGIWALVVSTVVGVAVSASAAWCFSSWRPSVSFSLRRLRGIARMSAGFFWSNSLAVVFAQLDKFIISRMLGGAALGTYSVAQRTVTSPVSAASSAVSTVSFSAFARGQDNHALLRSGTVRAAGVVTLVVLPAMVGLAVLADQAVLVVYGPQWEAAAPVIQILALVTAVQALSGVTSSVMQAKGRSDWLYRWGLAYCLAGAAAMVLAARWGLVGVSLGLAVVVAILAPLEMRMALGLIEMRLTTYLWSLVPLVAVTGVMAMVVWLTAWVLERTGASPSLQLLAGTAVGVAVYGGTVWRARFPAFVDALRVVGRRGGAEAPVVEVV